MWKNCCVGQPKLNRDQGRVRACRVFSDARPIHLVNMARKHGRTAPYEIMRQVGGAPPLPTARRTLRAPVDSLEDPPLTDPDGSSPRRLLHAGRGGVVVGWMDAVRDTGRRWAGAVTDHVASWGSAVRSPVALRLSGVAMGGIALVGVLLLAGVFWVGSQMGQRAVLTDAVAGDPAGGPGPVLEGAGTLIPLTPGAYGAVDTPGGAIDLPTADPRIPGYNYLCFVSLRGPDIDEARRIQRFFQQAGVATILTGSKIFDPASGKAPEGWIQVVDVSRGFSREQWFNAEHESFYTSRRALGRAWKAHNRGIGSDLNTMMFRKFKPAGS